MRPRLVATAVAICITAALAAAVLARGPHQDDGVPRAEKAKQIASAYFTSLMRGDTAVTTSLSAVPFAWDREDVIESLPALEKLYESVAANKGKRDIALTSIAVHQNVSRIVDDSFADDRIIVHVMVGDEKIALCVRPGDAYKVVGFSD